MGDIDGQRVAGVKTLHELGLIWSQGAWQKVPQGEFVAEADAMHAQLVRRRAVAPVILTSGASG